MSKRNSNGRSLPNTRNKMNAYEIKVVETFIAAINRHDLSGLSSLMTEDHTFVDPAGRKISGRENMMAGWKGYFQMFPDYEIQAERLLADEALVGALVVAQEQPEVVAFGG